MCCTSLFDVAENILEIAHTAVVGCTVVDCDLPGLAGYVSMGTQIYDPLADYLVVSIGQVFPAPVNTTGGIMHLPLYRVNYQVKLLETGWPMPTGSGEEIIPPPPDLVHHVTRHAYAHGEAMYRALANALVRKELNPGCRDCFQAISPLTPVEPSGGTVGWVTTLTLGTNFGGQ